MLSNLFSSILMLVIIIGLFAMIIAMIKTEKAHPLLIGLLCLVWTFTGVYNVFNMVKYYTSESQTYGTLEEHDPYENFNFYEYNLSREIAWYEDKETKCFYYQTTYATSIEFNGNENVYTLLINNRPCDFTKGENGRLTASQNIYFNNVDGQYKDTIKIDVTFTFYASNIRLRIDTNTTNANIDLLNEYLKVNGFNLRIIEGVYTPYKLLTDKSV